MHPLPSTHANLPPSHCNVFGGDVTHPNSSFPFLQSLLPSQRHFIGIHMSPQLNCPGLHERAEQVKQTLADIEIVDKSHHIY